MTVIPLDRDPRPIIDYGDYGQRYVIQKQLVNLLLPLNVIFRHDKKLVRIIRQTDSGGTFSRPERLSSLYLRSLVSEVARFQKIDRRGWKRGRPDKWMPISVPHEVVTGILESDVSELPFPKYEPEASGGAA
jgi:hypothetical protein